MQFWRLTYGDPGLGVPLQGSYDFVLVAVSLSVACLAGFAAFAVLDRLRTSTSPLMRCVWLAAGMGAMGGGIWAMHFTGMLAFKMPGGARYDLLITTISAIPAMLGSGCALHFMARPNLSWPRWQGGALLMAVGIGTMHYVGMEAMRMNAILRYDVVLFALSILVAHGLASVATGLRFVSSSDGSWKRFAAAAAMGSAVTGMHYTAMAAARFYPSPTPETALGHVFAPWAMGSAIFLIALLVTACAVFASHVTGEYEQARDMLRGTEARERSVLDSMIDSVILTDENAVIEAANPATERVFGYGAEELPGRAFETLVKLAGKSGEAAGALGGSRLQESLSFETIGHRKDGAEFPVDISVSGFDWQGRRQFSTLIRDVPERKAIESQLRQAGMAEIATSVLHNIGNVLNSANVSTSLLSESITYSKVPNLSRTVAMIQEHGHDVGKFFSEDEKGRRLPAYLAKLAERLEREQHHNRQEIAALEKNIAHIKAIVNMQQSYARSAGVLEPVSMAELVDDAIRLNEAGLVKHGLSVERDYSPASPVMIDRHKALQILVNVISNAKYAMARIDEADRQVRIAIRCTPDDRIQVVVMDRGVGIAKENLSKIFSHGFTNRKDGHGFGLHSSALAAKEINGSLVAESDGPGCGATFTLELPLAKAEALA